MANYYPRWHRVVLLPTLAAVVFGGAFIRTPWAPIRGLIVFAATWLLWRRFLRLTITTSTIRGRDPSTARRAKLELPSVVDVASARFAIGAFPGWVFSDSQGNKIFINEGALANETVRMLIENAEKGSRD